MGGRVYCKRDGSIATVVLENEGRLNALSLPMWRQLGAEFEALDADTDLRCIVLRGAGDAFAAGADIAEFENERHDVASAKIYGKAVHAALDAVSNCRHPVIALIHGPCVGGRARDRGALRPANLREARAFRDSRQPARRGSGLSGDAAAD